MANIFLGIYYNLSVWYKVTNQTKYAAIISLFGAAITILFNIVFIPKHGYIAAACATCLCYFIMAITSYFLGKKVFYIKYNTKEILSYFTIAIALYLISTPFSAGLVSGWLNLGVPSHIDNIIFRLNIASIEEFGETLNNIIMTIMMRILA